MQAAITAELRGCLASIETSGFGPRMRGEPLQENGSPAVPMHAVVITRG